MASEPQLQACQECGASIYPEMLQRHTAELWSGKLLCPHCLTEKRGGSAMGVTLAAQETATSAAGDALPVSKRVYGGGGITFDRAGSTHEEQLKRQLLNNDHATRCRTFHCRLNDTSINHMNQQINEFVDTHEDVQIKFATTCIGVVEGKHSEQHLFITIFY